MARSPIRAIVFDKDGTLFDLQATWGAFAGRFLRDCAQGDEGVFAALAEAAGYLPETDRLAPDSVMVAETPENIADTLRPYLPDPLPRKAFVDQLNSAAASATLAPAVPLVPLLTDLRERGLALAVATNDAEAPARTHLRVTGVADLFDFVFGYDSGHGGKPGPGQILAVSEALDVAPDALVMVGDSLHDLIAGRAAGARTVGVLTGAARERDLAPFADEVLPDIGYLLEWLDRVGGP